MTLWQRYKKISLLKKMLVAMIIGIIIGIVFGEKATVLEPFGTFFLNLLKMIATPLVIVNLIAGISSLSDPKMFGKIGGKILVYYFGTTIFAMILAIVIGSAVKPGLGFVLEGEYTDVVQTVPSIGSTIINLFPTNIFESLVNGKLDQVVVFSAFVGIGVLLLPTEQKDRVSSAFKIFSTLFSKLMGIIMLYAPVGVGALMAKTVGKYGGEIFGSLIKYIGSMYLCMVLMVAVYCTLLYIFTRIGPRYFLKKASPLIVTAFSTCSSVACIPVNLSCADDMGIPPGVSGFTIPLGGQINKDGMAMMLAMTFLFTSQAIGNPVSISLLIRLIFISLILTTGAGGIPGGGMVILAIVINAFGLPLEIVALISGIHSINEMGLTTLNCLGDLVGTTIVSFSGKDKKPAM